MTKLQPPTPITAHPTPIMSKVRRLLSMSSSRARGCTARALRGPAASPLSTSCAGALGAGRRREVLMSRTSSADARGGAERRWRLALQGGGGAASLGRARGLARAAARCQSTRGGLPAHGELTTQRRPVRPAARAHLWGGAHPTRAPSMSSTASAVWSGSRGFGGARAAAPWMSDTSRGSPINLAGGGGGSQELQRAHICAQERWQL